MALPSYHETGRMHPRKDHPAGVHRLDGGILSESKAQRKARAKQEWMTPKYTEKTARADHALAASSLSELFDTVVQQLFQQAELLRGLRGELV